MIRVGTCSWSDASLVKEGHFYPAAVRTPEQRLRYYASQFNVVEIDATYYQLPAEDIAAQWSQRTPQRFLFDVKAYAALTLHPTPLGRLPADIRQALPPKEQAKTNVYLRDFPDELASELWERFRAPLDALARDDKLGAILLQFPRWVFPSHESREYISQAKERLRGYRCAVEFRHGSWLNDKNRERTLAFLRDLDLTYVIVDEPQVSDASVPPLLAVTSPQLAIVRFHGHNAAAWGKRGITAAERFEYLYSEQELHDWAPRVRQVASEASETHALMNNCFRDYATTNARQLADLLAS